MLLPIFNQPHAIDLHPIDYWGFKTTPKKFNALTQVQKYVTADKKGYFSSFI